MKCVIYKILLWVERLFLLYLALKACFLMWKFFCVGLNLRLREG